jgi:hypothetical protein
MTRAIVGTGERPSPSLRPPTMRVPTWPETAGVDVLLG